METLLMRLLTLVLPVACVLFPGHAGSAMIDEIQVYTDDINKPGEFGLELHVNTTPSGRRTADFPREITPHHGLRITPEFSYGLTRDFEAGLYLPYARDIDRTMHFGGPKLRLKWLPVQTDDSGHGWFAGANLEYAFTSAEFEQVERGLRVVRKPGLLSDARCR